jgi:hypothetical protein
MIWQDLIITIANLLFTFSLFGQVSHGFKKKKGFIMLKTAGLTSLGLYLVAMSFLTLNLHYSGAVSFINATLWAIIFFQRLIYKKA